MATLVMGRQAMIDSDEAGFAASLLPDGSAHRARRSSTER
jgi:hypothetical protein